VPRPHEILQPFAAPSVVEQLDAAGHAVVRRDAQFATIWYADGLTDGQYADVDLALDLAANQVDLRAA
jgi:hypothetical protein